jgi:hypothetical protein
MAPQRTLALLMQQQASVLVSAAGRHATQRRFALPAQVRVHQPKRACQPLRIFRWTRATRTSWPCRPFSLWHHRFVPARLPSNPVRDDGNEPRDGHSIACLAARRNRGDIKHPRRPLFRCDRELDSSGTYRHFASFVHMGPRLSSGCCCRHVVLLSVIFRYCNIAIAQQHPDQGRTTPDDVHMSMCVDVWTCMLMRACIYRYCASGCAKHNIARNLL